MALGIAETCANLGEADGILAAFSNWDKDRSGTISQIELKRVLGSIGFGENDIPKLFRLMDVNQDGLVSYEEFVQWIFGKSPTADDTEGLVDRKKGRKKSHYDAVEFALKTSEKLIRQADVNGDGQLGPQELAPLLNHIFYADPVLRRLLTFRGVMMTVEQMLNEFDANDDGFIGYEELFSWISRRARRLDSAENCEPSALQRRDTWSLKAHHFFLTPDNEARLEKETLLDLHGEANVTMLQEAGVGDLRDSALLVLSVGSSSTQVYDVGDIAVSFSMGMKVFSETALDKFRLFMEGTGTKYTRALLLNAIGYKLEPSDTCTVPLAELAARAGEGTTPAALHSVLKTVMPESAAVVYNRSKCPVTKKYKHRQPVNDFSQALAKGRDASGFDAIVDWGGGSYKVFFEGRRVGTEVMDANATLCEGGVLSYEQHAEAIEEIKIVVHELVPSANSVMIAQTGLARELALKT